MSEPPVTGADNLGPLTTSEGTDLIGPIHNPSKFRGKSKFMPPKHRNASIDTYCRLVERDVRHTLNRKSEYKVYNNMTKDEREALKMLSDDATLIIKNSDKGSAIVVQNRVDYETGLQTTW